MRQHLSARVSPTSMYMYLQSEVLLSFDQVSLFEFSVGYEHKMILGKETGWYKTRSHYVHFIFANTLTLTNT